MKWFKLEEFDCSFTGKNVMSSEFLRRLDLLRENCGFPFVITSGYRDALHPEERKKERPGTHNQGIAADIAIHDGIARYIVVKEALNLGFTGIGVAKTFIHVDIREGNPVIWTY